MAKYKRIYRSRKNKIFAGVCGGIGEYLNIDPIIIRLCWIALTLLSVGAGIVVYALAWIIMPRK